MRFPEDRPIYGHSKWGEDPKSELMVAVAAILAKPKESEKPDPVWHREFTKHTLRPNVFG